MDLARYSGGSLVLDVRDCSRTGNSQELYCLAAPGRSEVNLLGFL